MAVAGSRGFALFIFIPFSLSLSGTYRESAGPLSTSLPFRPPSSLSSPPFHLAIFIFLPFIIYYPHCFIWYIYLADLSSFRLFQPFHIFALLVRATLLRFILRIFTDIRAHLVFSYFRFYFRHERTTGPLVKTFLVPSAVISAALLVMQFRSRLTLDNKLMG